VTLTYDAIDVQIVVDRECGAYRIKDMKFALVYQHYDYEKSSSPTDLSYCNLDGSVLDFVVRATQGVYTSRTEYYR
jgi:hypothetical protein